MARKLTKSGRLLYGVAVNDCDYVCSKGVTIDGVWKKTWSCPYMVTWKSMLGRCYSRKSYLYKPSYKGCTVCDEWLTFSNFKRWMEQQDWENRSLDKDLLFKGNKVYSPTTCVFVPQEVNQIVSHRKEGILPLGVYYEPSRHKYRAMGKITAKERKFLGRCDNALDAHLLWVSAKLKRVNDLQLQYKDETKIVSALNRVKGDLEYALKNRCEIKEL